MFYNLVYVVQEKVPTFSKEFHFGFFDQLNVFQFWYILCYTRMICFSYFSHLEL